MKSSHRRFLFSVGAVILLIIFGVYSLHTKYKSDPQFCIMDNDCTYNRSCDNCPGGRIVNRFNVTTPTNCSTNPIDPFEKMGCPEGIQRPLVCEQNTCISK